MSVEVPIELSAPQAHDAATDEVNRWRGHCVERFARLERSMGEALKAIAIASQSARGAPRTFGDRVKALDTASSPHLPTRLMNALKSAKGLLDQRNRIVHATGKVWINGSGSWAWAYRFTPAGKAEETGVYEQKAALRFESELAKVSQSLCDQLRAVSKKVAVTE